MRPSNHIGHWPPIWKARLPPYCNSVAYLHSSLAFVRNANLYGRVNLEEQQKQNRGWDRADWSFGAAAVGCVSERRFFSLEGAGSLQQFIAFEKLLIAEA
jgi:hypothetical protein